MKAVGQVTCALVLVAALAADARAQASVPLTLDEAVRRGVAQAPSLAEARAHESAAAAAAVSVGSLGLPTFTGSAAYLRTNHVNEFGFPPAGGAPFKPVFPDLPNNYRVRGELNVPLYTAGRVDALITAAQDDARAVIADRRVTEQDVRLGVIRAYWVLVTARESVNVIERGLTRTAAYVGDVRSRVDAGVLPPNDLLTAQSQRARQAVRLAQAQNAAASAEIDLGRLVGVPAGQHIVTTTAVTDATPGMESVAGKTPDALIARALEQRAEREGLLSRQASFEARATAASLSLKPQVGGVAALEPSRPNLRFVPRTDEWKLSWDLGVSVVWPLFDGGKSRADRATASANAEAVGARLKDFDAVVEADVRLRLLDLESSRVAVTASDEAVAAATEARRVVEERFRAGVATSTDVLDAEVAQLESELERTLLAAAVRLSEARLLRTVGGW